MTITDMKIRKLINDGSRLKAIVSVTFENMLVVHDIKVIQGNNGLFVAMPSRKDEQGVFRDIVHPINTKTRKYIEDEILSAYQSKLNAQQTTVIIKV